ncbi:MAG: hypothetical protein E1N59_799 [Puniceicoccaceae bacterium 5H]|nr:MAG: hypothetical protein E1N59_799 [Puniceicoccaceae bacterium 5H]
MKRFYMLALAGVSAFTAPFALAQNNNATPSSEVPSEEMDLANQLLEVTNGRRMIDDLVERYSQILSQSLVQAAQESNGSPEAAQQIADEISTWFEGVMSWDQIEPMIAEAYAKAYTSDELQGLIEFYHSDLGQKLLEKQPELMQRSMQIGQQYIQQFTPELQRRLLDARQRIMQGNLDQAKEQLQNSGILNRKPGMKQDTESAE